MTMTDIQKIQAITKDILQGYYGSTQKCGTETQKYTYAFEQAKKIYATIMTTIFLAIWVPTMAIAIKNLFVFWFNYIF